MSRGNAALQAVLVNAKPVIGLLQKRRYRLRGKSRSFHRSPLPCDGSLEKPRFERFSFRGEYQLDYSWERSSRLLSKALKEVAELASTKDEATGTAKVSDGLEAVEERNVAFFPLSRLRPLLPRHNSFHL